MKLFARKNLLIIGKTMVMLLMVALVVSQVHWRDYQVVGPKGETTNSPGLFSCMSNFHPWLLAVATGLQLLTVYLAAFRWRLLMLVQGISLDRRSVIRLSYLGEFFNTFLPGAMGGDAVKAFYVMRHTGKKGATLVSIFANRFVGLLAMVGVSVIVLVGWLVSGQGDGVSLKQPVFSIFFIAIGIVVVLFFALNTRLNNSRSLQVMIARLPFSRQLEVLREALHRHRNMQGMQIPILFNSVLVVLSFVLSVMFVGMSLGINLTWYHYFLYMPLIMIMTAVPITPGGVGVMEELFLYFFSAAGDPQKILAMALLYRLTLIVCGLPGVGIFLGSTKISRQEIVDGLGDIKTTGYPIPLSKSAEELSHSESRNESH